MTVFILAAGESSRFCGPVRKQFVEVEGQRVIDRIISQVRARLPEAPIVIVSKDMLVQGELHLNPVGNSCTADTFASTARLHNPGGNLVLFSDVYFTQEAIDRILGDSGETFYTDGQDLFGFRFDGAQSTAFVEAARAVTAARDTPEGNKGRIWEVYRRLYGLPTHPVSPGDELPNLTFIQDRTQDFDTLGEYDAFLRGVPKLEHLNSLKNPGKMLLIAQFTNSDVKQMTDLIRLICDLRTANDVAADLVFMPKPEVRVWEKEIMKLAARKFGSVLEVRGTRKAMGWPAGPNALVMDAFFYASQLHRSGKFDYTGAMLLESDCVPLSKTWLGEIEAEFRNQSGYFLGHIDTTTRPHMNGNLVFNPRVFDFEPDMAYGEPPDKAWDWVWWPKIQPYATASRLIFSDYKLGTMENPWKGCDYLWSERTFGPTHPYAGEKIAPRWLHGIKKPLGVQCARKRLLSA